MRHEMRITMKEATQQIVLQPHKSTNGISTEQQRDDFDIETAEMVYPWFKLTAKLVHEFDAINCTRAGAYYLVFSNRHSWVKSRTVDLLVQTSDTNGAKRHFADSGGAQPAPIDANDASTHIIEQLHLVPHSTQ